MTVSYRQHTESGQRRSSPAERENICHLYDYEESLTPVNHLDHRPVTELRAKDKEERIEYIKKELNISRKN